MDINLSDGLAFNIFSSITVEAPIIFTTAYDEYAIQAFKVNSIDYLLKPIDAKQIRTALQKYHTLSKRDLSQYLLKFNSLHPLIQGPGSVTNVDENESMKNVKMKKSK
jgi:DNA-binding LytR/AlgR family response regulator